MVKLYLDAGHGGHDNGANGNGLLEKNVILKITQKINSLLQDFENITIKQSRSSDKYLSLKQRTDEANKWGADLFLSVHINAGGGTGFESYIYNGLSNSSKTNSIRNNIHDEIMKMINVTDRGKKKANFHVLRESKMNALLTENLFIDTKSDSEKLKSNAFISKIAQGHVNGIVKEYNLKKKTVKHNDKLYKVQTGAYNKKENADNMEKNLKKDGYETYVLKENDLYKVQTGAFSKKENAEQLEKELKKDGYETYITYQ